MLNTVYAPMGRLVISGESYKILSVHEHHLVAEALDNEPKQERFYDHHLKKLLARGALEHHPFGCARQRTAKDNRDCPSNLTDLSEAVRNQVEIRLAWCHAFLDLEAEGKLKRTDASIAENVDCLHNKVITKLGQTFAAVNSSDLAHTPSPRTLRYWLKRYLSEDGGIRALIPKSKRNKARKPIGYSGEAEALLNACVKSYLSRQKPSQKRIAEETQTRFKDANQTRLKAGLSPFEVPSVSTVKRRIQHMEPYLKCLHREGQAVANRKFALYEDGISARFPGEIIQIDSWRIDLITLFASSQSFRELSSDARKQIEKGRRWITLAIDSATRVILGFQISTAPNTETSISVLAEIMRDKTDLARASECEFDWSQKTGLGTVLTDSGSEFSNARFESAVVDLFGDAQRPPAGLPHLRAHVERVFRTYADGLLPNLTARVFESVKARGDYPSEALAALCDDNLARILTRFIVDIYHQSPHDGLKGYTPQQKWEELKTSFPPIPLPDQLTMTRVFGKRFERSLRGNGVLQYSIHYNSPDLQDAFLKSSHRKVEIAVLSSNLGACAVRIGEKWHLAKAIQSGLENVSLDEWAKVCAEINSRKRTNKNRSADVIQRALARIREWQTNANTLMRVCPITIKPSAQEAYYEDLFASTSTRDYEPYETLPPNTEFIGRTVPSSQSNAERAKQRSHLDKNETQVEDIEENHSQENGSTSWRLTDE